MNPSKYPDTEGASRACNAQHCGEQLCTGMAGQASITGAAKADFRPKSRAPSQAEQKEIAEKMQSDYERRERQRYVDQLIIGFQALQQPTLGVFESLATAIHGWNTYQGFWNSDNTGEKLMLMVSEISEAMEADRKDLASEKIHGFTGVEEELADLMIRVFDYAGKHNLRLADAMFAKLVYNCQRPYMHGKKY